MIPLGLRDPEVIPASAGLPEVRATSASNVAKRNQVVDKAAP